MSEERARGGFDVYVHDSGASRRNELILTSNWPLHEHTTREDIHARISECRARHYRRDQVRGIPDQGRADDRQVRWALLTKGGSHKFPEGGHWKPERVVIIEFPDMDSLNRWYNAPEYKPLIALRKACTSDLDMLITLEGA